MYFLYVLSCDGRALYTGITTDVARRLNEHAAGRGAKALRKCRELTVVYQVEVGPKGDALRLEYQFKKLSRQEKLAVIAQKPPVSALCQLLGIVMTPDGEHDD